MVSFINSFQNKLSIIAFLILLMFSITNISANQAVETQKSISKNGEGKMFPIQIIGTHIFTKIKLNGDEQYWVIDTGAGNTVIDTAYAKSKNLTEIGKAKAIGASGETEIVIYNIPRLLIKETSIENLNVISFDVYGIFKTKLNIEVAGVLGFDFFSKYVMKIDYDDMLITLYEPNQFKYQGTGTAVNFQLANNIILVPLKIKANLEGAFALDTGASATILSYPFALKNKFTDIDGPDRPGRGASGSFILRSILLNRVEFGGYFFDDIIIGYPSEKIPGILGSEEINGTLGFNILRNFVIYLDYSKKVLYLEKGKKFNQALPWDKSGLLIETNKNGLYEIMYISKKSAAQTAGLKVGDVITTVNKKKPAEFRGMDELRSIFEDKNGTRIDLKIMRDSKEYDIPLILIDPYKQ